MREWRKLNPLRDYQKLKANCRSYANAYLRRGKLKRKPCKECGAEKAQMHHKDYSKPLRVQWLCATCHRKLHYREWEKKAGFA